MVYRFILLGYFVTLSRYERSLLIGANNAEYRTIASHSLISTGTVA